jgi:formamidopyrimidine-DNA glycosylase
MPELPEVETIARGVDARVRGDRIVEAWFSSYPQTFKTPQRTQAKGLEGCAILQVHRTGKHIVCELLSDRGLPAKPKTKPDSQPPGAQPPDSQWIVHLGMTGRLLVTTPDKPLEPHTHARLRLESGREIRFVDPRRFGRLEFRRLKTAQSFSPQGAEPLAIAAPEFAGLFRGRKLPIKAALLNQRLLSGVGNIYADESLFRAGIRPRRPAGRLTRAELEKLRLDLKAVLEDAIRLGGSSVSDYVDAEGVRGFFQLEHRVYQRTGEPCLVCRTPIRRIVVAGRSTHFCPTCQK